ncbi:hypothetical protein WMF11_30700 [Sorangium sp. So ce295]|uniref:hypothetical protein n=1 Tax=Sorangium sp. So ce295 TaxID=3133295 RepID=UPI003F6442B1
MPTHRLISLSALLTSLAVAPGCAFSPEETDAESTDEDAAPLTFTATPALGSPILVRDPAVASTVTIQGKLTRLSIGRASTTGQNGGNRYFVTGSDHKLQEVEISATVAAQAGGFDAILGRTVAVTGSTYSARGGLVATQLTAPASAVASLASLVSGSTTGNKRWLLIPCSFTDLANPTPHTRAYFEGLMGNTRPGLGDYWSTASHGRLSIETTVLDWQSMPNPASFYNLQTSSEKLDDLVNDCLSAAFVGGANVFDFDGFALAFSHNLENQVVAGTLQTPERTHGFSVLSPVEFSHQASVARAMGAGIDLTYSGTAALRFDSPWDVMSQGFALSPSGLSCSSLTASFGCGAVFPAAEHTALAGWLTPSQILSVPTNSSATADLDFVGTPPLPGHHGVIRVPIDATHYYTIEARRQSASTYDAGVPRSSLVIQRMDVSPLPDEPTAQQITESATRLRLVEAPAPGVTTWSGGSRLTVSFTPQATGYRVIVDRLPPPPPPPPEPEPEPEPLDCWDRCRGPVYKCEQICGGF